jgi:hypothetical protein
MHIRLEDYFISIKPFIDTPQLLRESQTSLLLTKYYNNTNVLLNTTNFDVYFYPWPFRDFSTLIMQLRFLNYDYQLFVEEKN